MWTGSVQDILWPGSRSVSKNLVQFYKELSGFSFPTGEVVAIFYALVLGFQFLDFVTTLLKYPADAIPWEILSKTLLFLRHPSSCTWMSSSPHISISFIVSSFVHADIILSLGTWGETTHA